MSKIDWSEAPHGAEWFLDGIFYRQISGFEGEVAHWNGSTWHANSVINVHNLTGVGAAHRDADFQPLISIEDAQPYTRDDAIKFLVENIKCFPSNDDSQPACNGWKWIHVYGPMMAFSNGVKAEDIFEVDFNHAKKIYRDSLRAGKDDAKPATAKQSAPSGNGNPILGMVLADLTNRALEGKEKYGEPLKAHNGRNALWDAYQEALDLAMYLRQAIEEQSK